MVEKRRLDISEIKTINKSIVVLLSIILNVKHYIQKTMQLKRHCFHYVPSFFFVLVTIYI